MNAVLVTGALGLVGNAVRRQLEAAGRKVVAVDIAARTEEELPITVADVRDIHRLHAIVPREGPFEAVIHCGALSGPMLARDNPVLVCDINLGGTINLLEICRIYGVKRFVLCSSVSAYGSTPAGLATVSEDAPLLPSTVYGASKAASEAIAQGYASQHGVDSICLRIGWVYGPRRSTDCDIRDMILAGLRGETFRRAHGTDIMRQYVHVDDIAGALILAADAPSVSRRSYTVTDGSFLPLPEVAEIVRRHLPGLVTEIGPGAFADEDIQARFDLSAVRKDFGFAPSLDLDRGIEGYIHWLSAQ